ncbi:glycosyltransferase family 87 protein [Microbacter margulisiae]|uniref:DUF2029 domain-containing protein n=1 Tax=Microbacter margulisiae TaxID=1350067 RepID=A0A7W5H296_9PORP|nr:glycosyltransferase family 87 protein [Microbacter margulisiae]MBB3188448.1 hypothetical protein [Microbacter margulisiae]
MNPLLKSVKTASSKLLNRSFWQDYRTSLIVWIGTGLFIAIKGVVTHSVHNNYLIYKYVFWHVVEKLPLFPPYPHLYQDVNNYGPLFGVIIAPFALLPDWLGVPLWEASLALLLFAAIRQLPLKQWQHAVIFWFSYNSLFTSLTNVQFNIAIVALIILTLTSTRKEKEIWASLFIVIGTLVKLYGIVGLAFLFFSRRKLRFIGWLMVWFIVLGALPMVISSPEYILNQYAAWGHELILKNRENTFSLMQDMSVMGMIRKTTGHFEWSNFPMLAVGAILFLVSYLQFNRYRQAGFQMLTLASVLLFTVLFSTSTEPNTFIIGIVGVAIWFVIQPHSITRWQWILLTLAFVFTSMPSSDLFPAYLRNHYMFPYALLALPCTIIWFTIVYETTFLKHKTYNIT